MPTVPKKKPIENPSSEVNGEWAVKYSLLTSTLQLAVPLWIEQLKKRDWDYVLARARECSETVARKGDVILFKGKKRGESADAFNRLAEGIACLSFCPGGVKIFGSHWESCLQEDGPKRASDALKNLCKSILGALSVSPEELKT